MDMSTTKVGVGLLVAAILLGAGYVAFSRNANMPTENNISNQNGSQGKLDMNVVCASALAYMTFADGASAEAFVNECKEGKHPEVLERYKKDMGLGDGAAI